LVVGEGALFAATLAWSEPLTALPRSARSRVSSSRSLWKAATRAPSPPGKVSQLHARRKRSSTARASKALVSHITHGRAELRSARYASGGKEAVNRSECDLV